MEDASIEHRDAKVNTDVTAPPNLLNRFLDNLDYIQDEWLKLETRLQTTKAENERLNDLLHEEKSRHAVYQRQIKFIQDNQRSFERLRQIYLDAKSAKEERKPPMAEETSQTDEEMPIDVKRMEIDKALDMVVDLKSMIQKRDATDAMNQLKACEYERNATRLTKENDLLKTYLHAKQLEMESLKTDEKLVELCVNENKLLRRLLQKFDRFIRTAERTYKPIKYPELKEDEKELIDYLNDPYEIEKSRRNIVVDGDRPSTKSNVTIKSTSSRGLLSKSNVSMKRQASRPAVVGQDKLDVLEKLRVFQPEFGQTRRSTKTKKHSPCAKLQTAFITQVMSSTSCKKQRKL